MHIQFCKKKKDKQKPQLNRDGRPEREALMPFDKNRAQQEKERILFFPGKDSANEKPWTLCFLQPSQLPFSPSIKVFSFPCPEGICMQFIMIADPKLQLSAHSKEIHLCWRNIWQSVCFRSKQFSLEPIKEGDI